MEIVQIIYSVNPKKRVSLEDVFSSIYKPLPEDSEIVKCLRRYRKYLIGINQESKNNFLLSFSFGKEELCSKFEHELLSIQKRPPT